jgi:hypothetical protein
MLKDANAVAVWLRQTSADAELVAQRISEDGPESVPFALAHGTVHGLGYPRVQRIAESVMVSWSGNDGKEVKTALISATGHSSVRPKTQNRRQIIPVSPLRRRIAGTPVFPNDSPQADGLAGYSSARYPPHGGDSDPAQGFRGNYRTRDIIRPRLTPKARSR